MTRIGIAGGETHIGEITKLTGSKVEIPVVAVRTDQVEWAESQFGCQILTNYKEMLARDDLDAVAVANENHLKAEVILAALSTKRDVIVDKPLAVTMDEQDAISSVLTANPDRRLVMLLTLRGHPIWSRLRTVVQDGKIGTPAFTHVRMAVQLKRSQRPEWFLDVRRSGGVFLDLLIHGLDQVEWITGRRIEAMTANTGNLGDPADVHLRDHASVYCELDDGSSAVVEGQRMLPDTKGSDYRVTIAGTEGYADLWAARDRLAITSPGGADLDMPDRPDPVSVVEDWLSDGTLVGQAASLRANRLALVATASAERRERLAVPAD